MKKFIIGGAAVVLLVAIVAGTGTEDETEPTTKDTSSQVANQPGEKGHKAKPEKAEPSMTSGQEQATRKAEEYLSVGAFSKSGLVEQLVFEGFTKPDAQYAVDHLDVNWTEQAKAKAAEYLSVSAFSKSGLVEQLMFEGFTQAQAAAGADAALS